MKDPCGKSYSPQPYHSLKVNKPMMEEIGMEMKDHPQKTKMFHSKRGMRQKFIIAGLLFLFVWGMFQIDMPWAKQGQQLVRGALTQEIAYQTVSAWYERNFSGAPSFIPSFRTPSGQDAKKVDAAGLKSFITPVLGKIITPYSSIHPAITLQTQANAVIRAIETGRVIFAGLREETGYTIVIQHSGGFQSTYGMLQPMQWVKNDWITIGEVVGKAATPQGQTKGNIVLALMKDAEYMNPTDVMSFE
jgi:stage IV sporulation protein FA